MEGAMGRSLLLVSSVLFAVAVACGSQRDGWDDGQFKEPTGDNGGTSGGTPGFANVSDADVASVAIEPPTATLAVENNVPGTQQFKLIATLVDGKKGEVPATWTANNFPVGAIGSNGIYTANGQLGGVV
jgi:hypothetical protein